MSYIYASCKYYDLNNFEYDVYIIHNVVGADLSYDIHVDSEGAVISYEQDDDTIMAPGIVHSTCNITTIWPTSLDAQLETLSLFLLDSEDGEFILRVDRDGSMIWFGTIMTDQVKLSEQSDNKTLSIKATDGLSMLKHVPFSNGGTPYTGNFVIWTDLLDEVFQKWVLYDYWSSIVASGYVAYTADDVYNAQDVLYATLPPGSATHYNGLMRNRLNALAWYKTNNQDEYEFISTYDLVLSICNTYQLRLYCYGQAWYFIPVNLSDQSIYGYARNLAGSSTATTISHSYDFQITNTDDIRQKGIEWEKSYTPQINEVKLNRDTNDGSVLISSFNTITSVSKSITDLTIYGSDTEGTTSGFNIVGRVYIGNSSSGVSLSDRCGRFALRFKFHFTTSTSDKYYVNELTPSAAGRIDSHYFDAGSFDFAPVTESNVGYVSSAGFYYYHPAQNDAYYYDLNLAGDRYLNFQLNIPLPPTAHTGLNFDVTPIVLDSYGDENSTLRADWTGITFKHVLLAYYSQDGLSALPNFDYVATSTYGRGSYEMGKTHIGDLPVAMGGVEVQTGSTTWEVNNNWACQADSTERNINVLAVEETLAAHYKARYLERGSIVLRGRFAEPSKPFSRFYDNDTGIYYSAINWTLRSSMSEMDVTLRKLGRNAIDITTNYENPGDISRDPTEGNQGISTGRPDPIMFSYNNRARLIFNQTWTSVVGTGTMEMYWTITNDGQGKYIDHQGESPAAGYSIFRTVYVQTRGLQESSATGWTTPSFVQPALDTSFEDTVLLVQEYMSKVDDHGSYTFVITYEEITAFSGLLDTYAGATAAYSLRRLTVTYTGALIRIRRDSDNAETDIGFDSNGDLDESAITTFAGGSACYVVIMYDQSGNTLNMVQVTTTQQPVIYSGSVFYSIGAGSPARKAMLFATTFLRGFGDLHSGSFYAASAVVMGSTIGNSQIFCQDDAGTGGAARVAQYLRTGSANNTARIVVFDTGGGNTADNTGNNTVAANNAYVIQSQGQTSQCEAFVDNASNGHTSVGTSLNHGSTTFTMGSNSHSSIPGAFFNGRIAEVIIWDGTMSGANRAGIQINIETYYSI